MSYTRSILCKKAEQLNIPKKLIGHRADTGASNISIYFGFGPISQKTEEAISQAIRDVVAMLERFGPIRIDLDDISMVDLFLSKLEMESFIIMLSAVPTEFFLKREKEQTRSTRFYLEATSFNFAVADAIALDIKDQFPSVTVLSNPYFDKPQVAWTTDPRISPEYIAAMGLE